MNNWESCDVHSRTDLNRERYIYTKFFGFVRSTHVEAIITHAVNGVQHLLAA